MPYIIKNCEICKSKFQASRQDKFCKLCNPVGRCVICHRIIKNDSFGHFTTRQGNNILSLRCSIECELILE